MIAAAPSRFTVCEPAPWWEGRLHSGDHRKQGSADVRWTPHRDLKTKMSRSVGDEGAAQPENATAVLVAVESLDVIFVLVRNDQVAAVVIAR
jgi:hypothetical protein